MSRPAAAAVCFRKWRRVVMVFFDNIDGVDIIDNVGFLY
jgi:hypothetical protein